MSKISEYTIAGSLSLAILASGAGFYLWQEAQPKDSLSFGTFSGPTALSAATTSQIAVLGAETEDAPEGAAARAAELLETN